MIVIAFNVLLYIFCEKQKNDINTISDQQKVETQVNTNRFKYQQDQIEHLSKDLEDARQQIKNQNVGLFDQKDALLQEIEKREQVEIESKSIQTSLVDIKAEADAIKQDMKGWQKDYVSVLAQLEKKMDASQEEEESVKESINSLKAAIEKMSQPSDNSLSSTPAAPEVKKNNDENTL